MKKIYDQEVNSYFDPDNFASYFTNRCTLDM